MKKVFLSLTALSLLGNSLFADNESSYWGHWAAKNNSYLKAQEAIEKFDKQPDAQSIFFKELDSVQKAYQKNIEDKVREDESFIKFSIESYESLLRDNTIKDADQRAEMEAAIVKMKEWKKLEYPSLLQSLLQKYPNAPKPFYTNPDIIISPRSSVVGQTLGAADAETINVRKDYEGDRLVVAHEFGHYLNGLCLKIKAPTISLAMMSASFDLSAPAEDIKSCSSGGCYNDAETIAMMFVDYENGALPRKYKPIVEKHLCLEKFKGKVELN